MSEIHVCKWCGSLATVQFKNGEWCCSKSPNSCPAKKNKHDQRGEKNPAYGKPPWNKGLTKETDTRVSEYADACSKTKAENPKEAWNKGLTKETDTRVSEYAKRVSATKKGKPNLKKRVSVYDSIRKYAGSVRQMFKKHLYLIFVKPVMERDNFTCQRCNTNVGLEVHHIKPYREIFDESMRELNIDFSKIRLASEEIIGELHSLVMEKHKDLSIGITLCKSCHSEVDIFRKGWGAYNERKRENDVVEAAVLGDM